MKGTEQPTIQRVYEELRRDITFGKFKGKEHLSEKLLTQTYQASRATIREVIGMLTSQGYLTFKSNQGAIVSRLSLNDIDVIYNVLSRCESYAASLFAKNHDKNIFQNLKQIHSMMINKEIQENYKEWLQLNENFHELIYLNCGSEILSNFIYHTRLRIYRFRNVVTDFQFINFYNKQHKQIIDLIAKRNEKLTEKFMSCHLESARKHRLDMFRRFKDIF